jgi:hypothetical protein
MKELATIFRAEIESLSHAAHSFVKRGIDFRVAAVAGDDSNVEGGGGGTKASGLTRSESPTSQRCEVANCLDLKLSFTTAMAYEVIIRP